MKIFRIALCVVCIFSIYFLYAEQYSANRNSKDTDFEDAPGAEKAFLVDAQLAMSVPDYQVTAGDVYMVSFIANSTPVSYSMTVDSTYRIRIANLGMITCSGLTFLQLKRDVESLVMRNYPLSGAQFTMVRPSTFKVRVMGEVPCAQELTVWALSRLSSVLTERTPFSSVRGIEIEAVSGKKKKYDLFFAERNGDFSQDPYLRPGDIITVPRSERKVTVSGSVERAGLYDILPGENLKALIGTYASGVTSTADTSRIRLVRIDKDDAHLKKVLYVTQADIERDFELEDGDSVFVADWSDMQPFIEVKGCIRNPLSESTVADGNDARIAAIYKQKISFYIDETYSSFIRRSKELFTEYSDISGIYIERNGAEILLNADAILDDMDFTSPYFVEKNDVLIVPYLPVFSVDGSAGWCGSFSD